MQAGDEVNIVIDPDRDWSTRLITVVLVAVVFPIPAVVLAAALGDGGPTGVSLLIVVAFEILGIALLLVATHDALWILFGREEFTLDASELTIATTLFGRRRVRSFVVDRISNLRYEERAGPRGRRAIVFEYDGKEIVSRHQLTREEGRGLIHGPLRRTVIGR